MAWRLRSGELGRMAVAAAVVALAAVAFLLVVKQLGIAALALLAAATVGLVVVQRPGWALALVLVPAVLIEDTEETGFVPSLAAYFEQTDMFVLSPLQATVALLVAAAAFDAARRGELRMPEPLTLPLALLTAAILFGAVVGLSSGAAMKDVAFSARALLLVVLIPIVVVNVVRTRAALRRVLVVAAALAGAKALIGLSTLLAGQGYANPGDPFLTYYAPTANWLGVALILAVIAALLDRTRPPLWLIAIAVLSTASLLLSYRRSFWIAAVVGIVIVALVGAGRLRWRVIVAGGLVLAAALWVTLNTGAVDDVQGPLAERVESLQPTRIQTNPEDRYRFGERRNVLADLEQNPLTGLGLAVPWTARYGLSVDRPGSREYVHITSLWWWLRLGILGLVAYVWLTGAAIWTAFRTWREQVDAWIRAAALGVFGALIGLALVETTGSFTGTNERLSVVLGAVLGFLCAGLADARSSHEPRELERPG